MRIGERQIGTEHSPYVIAEIGVNHDGSVERAIELVEAADRAGANAVKFQIFRTDLLMSQAAKLAAYQAAAGETDPLEMLRRLELSAEQLSPVVERAHDLGLHTIATVFSVELVAEAERVQDAYGGWDAYKSASPDIINRPLLEAMAATGKPLIVSTGASTLDEVRRAVGWLEPIHDHLALLQCVSSYPVPEGQDGLGGIEVLQDTFEDLPIGYSDHTDTVETAWMAVELGARLLEKHLTYDTLAAGPDHAASATPREFEQYAQHALWKWRHVSGRTRFMPPRMVPRAAKRSQGIPPRPEKLVLPCEFDVREVSRQSLTTRDKLTAGHVLTRSNLTIKRPGTGIEPWRLDEIIGRTLTRDVEGDTPLLDDDLA